jgi:hypothetical protein
MRGNTMAVITLFFGIWFTIFTAIAWTRGRRIAAALLGLIAAVDLALALQFLRNSGL